MAKKFFVALTLLTVLFTSSLAMAAFEENLEEDVDLATVKKLAIAYPSYYKVTDTEPNFEEFTQDLYRVGRDVSNLEVIPYAEIASAIRRNTGVDISTLDPLAAEKIFKENVGKYADAYLVATVANNSNRPWLFYYVYAADSSLMYTYSVQSGALGKTTRDYQKAVEGFYHRFDELATINLSKEDRKKFNEKKRYETGGKEKKKKVTYKTGISKEDLVKKK